MAKFVRVVNSTGSICVINLDFVIKALLEQYEGTGSYLQIVTGNSKEMFYQRDIPNKSDWDNLLKEFNLM